MAFRCPQCARQGSLEIVASMQLPADSRSDEIALQVVACPACAFQGLAVYEESRRGALEAESWDHTGCRVEAEQLQSVQAAIRACPEPGNAGCRCPSHLALGEADAHGRWRSERFLKGALFPMQWSEEWT